MAEYERQFLWDEAGRELPLFYFSHEGSPEEASAFVEAALVEAVRGRRVPPGLGCAGPAFEGTGPLWAIWARAGPH
jgi:hypothetical protein